MPPPTQPAHHRQPADEAADGAEAVLPLLDLEPLRPLLEHLADLLAERLADTLAARHTPPVDVPSRRLLTLDELVARLPPGKKPATWKAWLYQRTRIAGEVPGQHKLGGRLFFDPDQTLPWLLNHASGNTQPGGLDVLAEQSLHAHLMPLPAHAEPAA